MTEIKNFYGWILDVTTYASGIILWVKIKKENQVVQIKSEFQPEFFAVPKKGRFGSDFPRLKQILKSHPNIVRARLCSKYVSIDDCEKRMIFGVSVKNSSVFKSTIKDIEKLDYFTLYNTDIPIAQMYFYVNSLFPMALCCFSVSLGENNEMHLLSYELKDNNEDLFYETPPLRAVWLEIKVQQKGLRPQFNEPMAYAEIGIVENERKADMPRADSPIKRTILIDNGDEEENLLEIVRTIERIDPDIILTKRGDEFAMPYLVARASANRITRKFYLSRTKTPLKSGIFKLSGEDHFFSYGIIYRRSQTQCYLTGRFHLDSSAYGSLHFIDGNIPGVIEVARVSRVPIQRLTRVTIGGALQSIQFYNAYQSDILIPPLKSNAEDFKTALDLILADRGGHIFEPKIGVFNNVAELDFASMYPSLMSTYNISPETLNCKCCKDDPSAIRVPGLNYHICKKRRGIVSKSIEIPLRKRLVYKRIAKETGDIKYKYMQKALKWILVVSFGYLGFKNSRFGRIEAHQTVCAYSREFLLQSAEIAREYGYKIIHGIVDSLYIENKKGTSNEQFRKDCEEICKRIEEATKIPINIEGIYNFIVFMPSRANPKIPTLNHYWGVRVDGTTKLRGIDIRRRDTPRIVKEAQMAMINVFMNVKTKQQFLSKIPEAKRVLYYYLDKIDSGNVTAEELSVTIRVSRKPSQYKVNSYQAVAANQKEKAGVPVSAGQKVKFIITNAEADPSSAYKKVILSELYNPKKHQYDKKKYRELLTRAFKNIIPFELPDLENSIKSRNEERKLQETLLNFV